MRGIRAGVGHTDMQQCTGQPMSEEKALCSFLSDLQESAVSTHCKYIWQHYILCAFLTLLGQDKQQPLPRYHISGLVTFLQLISG